MPDDSKDGPPDSAHVLLLEDDPLLAKYFGQMLANNGAPEILTAHDNRTALDLIGKHAIKAAFLDVGLEGETSEATAHALIEQGIPFTFLSGRALDPVLEKTFPRAELLMKPASSNDIKAMLARLGC